MVVTKSAAKVLHFFDMTKYFAKKMQFSFMNNNKYA